jgi:hypothetical protein
MTSNTGHPLHGAAAGRDPRQEAQAVIAELEKAIKRCKEAPTYLAGPNYDPEENFDDVIENIEPWDRLAELQDRARANPLVVEILTEQGRLKLLSQ